MKRLFLLFCPVLLSACASVPSYTGSDAPVQGLPLLTVGPGEKSQELARYNEFVRGLGPDQLQAELARAEVTLHRSADVLDRFKYVLVLVQAKPGPDSYNAAASLMQEYVRENEGGDDLLHVYATTLAEILAQYVILARSQDTIGQENRTLTRSNENLRKQLEAAQAEVKKLDSQLSALKSIEQSILQRDMGKDGGIQ